MTTPHKLIGLSLLTWVASSAPGLANPSSRYGGSIQATFSAPQLRGVKIDQTGRFVFQDNTTTAVYSGFGSNAISWGSEPPGSGYPITFSSVLFEGNPRFDVRAGEDFDLGRITFTNGTSRQETSIFGANVTVASPSTFPSISPLLLGLDILTTINGNTDARRDADILQFREAGVLFPLTFNVLEGRTATAILRGRIVGDPYITLTGLVIDPDSADAGFVGTSQPIQEPSAVAPLAPALIFAAAFLRLDKRRARTT